MLFEGEEEQESERQTVIFVCAKNVIAFVRMSTADAICRAQSFSCRHFLWLKSEMQTINKCLATKTKITFNAAVAAAATTWWLIFFKSYDLMHRLITRHQHKSLKYANEKTKSNNRIETQNNINHIGDD